MRYSLVLGALFASASADNKPAVNPTSFKNEILRDNLVAGAKKLQAISDATPEKHRIAGSKADQETIKWLKESLESLDYYDVSLQRVSALTWYGNGVNAFSINGTAVPKWAHSVFSWSPTGKASAPLIIVEGGCNRTDYPPEVAGKITLISRGTCDYGIKAAYSGAAGAVGAILYNVDNRGPEDGTLLPPRPQGPYVPCLNLIKSQATPLIAALKRGEQITASFDVWSDIRNTTSSNIIATSKSGDQNNKLIVGAHTDGKTNTPGINEVGSSVIALLEAAKALSKYQINNAVTFAFWTTLQSEQKRGSQQFIDTLSAADNAKIRAYLNYDMTASQNYVHENYDGDGKVFGSPGPAGSAELQAFFQKHFESAGTTTIAKPYDGRSDHVAFIGAGIPTGGTSTGGDHQKTPDEAALFGGKILLNHFPCFWLPCDNVDELNLEAWEIHAKAMAEAVATYATSWEGFPQRNVTSTTKRSLLKASNGEKSRV